MQKKILNHTDLKIAPINLGGNVFGWTVDEHQSFEILDHFVGQGFNFIDTADTYSWWAHGTGGQSEAIIGNWLKKTGNRDQVVIATKVGSQTKAHDFDISRAHILKSVDASLSRLQTDYIDLYYTHFDDHKTPVEETLDTYHELIQAGKIRHIAVSNLSPTRIEASFEYSSKKNYASYIALQPLYNMMERQSYESDYLPIAEKYQLNVFPYFSLASGFLSGKYKSASDYSKSVRGGGMNKYLTDKGMEVLKAIESVAVKFNVSPATIALAWLLAQPTITAPIASATSIAQLNDILKAADLQLDEIDITLLNHVSR